MVAWCLSFHFEFYKGKYLFSLSYYEYFPMVFVYVKGKMDETFMVFTLDPTKAMKK
jgi:hypothetical protein